MQNPDLNLARKWRSKNFDQIIGQDLCVRILKNGLYLNSFFPVYLFSGQRGCGKTSMARIFAAAVNCEQLEKFQKDAKNFSVPCLKCVSCDSMQKGKHPDFIEIDAASHTGVDNVRNIIEASALLPLIGRKKIYLIDEAHMLSKAAFNAFLKILEEPPASVLFILATTDVQKIIDTVRSRSFQLFFTSISADNLITHLENICKQEAIEYDKEGLKIIVRESEGSARDAINLLEQVRFSSGIVNQAAVLGSLGHLSDEDLLLCFDILINRRGIKEFLSFLDDVNYYKFSAEFIWNRLLELLRAAIRVKHGLSTKDFINQEDKFREILTNCSLNSILYVMNEFCKNELIFYKSINKNLFLELLCLKIINSNLFNNDLIDSVTKKKLEIEKNIEPQIQDKIEKEKKVSPKETGLWTVFLEEIKKNNDPLLQSVFTQADFVGYDQATNQISISLSKKFIFFKELIDDTSSNWEPILKKVFNDPKCSMNIKFEDRDIFIEKIDSEKVATKKNIENKHEVSSIERHNFSDKEKWKMANVLLNYFPGTIKEIQEEDK